MSRHAYVAAFVSGMRRSLAARPELGVRMLFYVVILVVFSSLWRASVAAAGGRIAGYDYPAMLWDVAGAEGAVVATKPRLIEEVGSDIATGSIATEMLRPVAVVGFRLAAELGEAVARLACAAVIGAVLVSLFVGAPPSAPGALLALVAAVLAIACNLSAQHAFAGAAFWIEDAKASWFLYQKLVFLLGGMLLPLELLPHGLATVARLLPFWTTAYVPARLLSGHVEPALLLVQAGWLCALLAAAAGVFRLGERRFQVTGG